MRRTTVEKDKARDEGQAERTADRAAVVAPKEREDARRGLAARKEYPGSDAGPPSGARLAHSAPTAGVHAPALAALRRRLPRPRRVDRDRTGAALDARYAIDTVIPGGVARDIWLIAGAVVAVSLVQGLVDFVHLYLSAYAGQRIVFGIPGPLSSSI